ncbi:Metallo-dependent phosphatase-like protein [Echria macrotheca]|uniref:Metallo-dependent phosphatase-like protein n=1 Tax=Echria macrotheca TaxID=438768 RepID=A0AAJ0B230_9PEZI|nr:Metallo-dependent phosphatase-like protein [Echria macrotheca]
MPVPVLAWVVGHRPFRHHRRRHSALALLGMLATLATAWLLFAPSLSAMESLQATAENSPMTSYLQPHHPPLPNSAVSRPGQHVDHEVTATGSQKILTMEDETNARPPLFDLPDPLIDHLPAEHVLTLTPASHDPSEPSSESHKGKKPPKRRLVFVGDVHGHLRPLKALLRKIKFDHTQGDHLVLLGDLVAKGPDSSGVVTLAMEVGASAVRGNHEDKVLVAYKAIQRKKKKKKLHKQGEQEEERRSAEASINDEEKLEDESTDDEAAIARDKHLDHARAVARSLSTKQIRWLSSRPVALRIGAINGATNAPWDAGDIVAVHAGLVPAVPLKKQDPWAMMNIRTLLYPVPKRTGTDGDNATIPAIPSDTRAGEPWSRAWNRFQNTEVAAHSDRVVVIYGHDARAGLQADMEVRIRPHPASRHPHRTKRDEASGLEYIDPSSSSSDTGDDEEGEEETEDVSEVYTAQDEVGGDDNDEEDDTVDVDERKKRPGKRKKNKKKKKKGKGTIGIRYAFGLDSGCGHGRKLSALVLEPPGEDGKVAHWIEQVECGESTGK